jgi:hypothetical protein
VVPIIPFSLLFDGVVSCLSAYGLQELLEIISSLTASGYPCELAEHTKAIGSVPITYLIGFPQAGVPSS